MEGIRKPFQGVINIVRFNRHFYVIALFLFCALIVLSVLLPVKATVYILAGAVLMFLPIVISLAISFYIYDCSRLYKLDWLNDLQIPDNAMLANIHAGFDETSVLLAHKYPKAGLAGFDFYDPVKHTEVSIKRARKAYPAYPGTKSVITTDAFLQPASADYIFLILAAHEIRNREERIRFLESLKHSLKKDGNIIVTEHLRDPANFAAYNIGFFHFLSKREWMHTFQSAGLTVAKEIKVTPFIHTFILQ